MATAGDIQSYSIFANIDDRKGKIEGYMMFLSKKQMEAIEDIILSEDIKVKGISSYELVE